MSNSLGCSCVGLLACQVTGPNMPQLEAVYNIVMLARPVVSISPLTLAARQGDVINVTCSAFVPTTAYPNIRPPRIYWYRDQVLLGGLACVSYMKCVLIL